MPIHNENLRFLVWWMLTIFSLVAFGEICRWAWRHGNKWLLLLAVPPGTVLAYVVWRVTKGLALAANRDWQQIVIGAWVLFTFYLWERGNSYKEDAERERKWGQEKLAELYKERQQERV